MSCQRCGNKVVENKDTMLCGTCGASDRRAEAQAIKDSLKKKPAPLARPTKPIAKRSEKRATQEKIYELEVKIWKKGKKCGVKGCDLDCQDCHHQKGRDGDLLLNKDFWFPVCREHHHQITVDSAWAIREGYSISRNAVEQEDND